MVKKIAENFNRLSRVHQRHRQTDRQTTDGSSMAYSEREREFTSANKMVCLNTVRIPKFFTAEFVDHFCGVPAKNFHPRGNPVIARSIPAVFPQHSHPYPRKTRRFRGIPAVPITVHTTSCNITWFKLPVSSCFSCFYARLFPHSLLRHTVGLLQTTRSQHGV